MTVTPVPLPRPPGRVPILGDVRVIDFAKPIQGITAELHALGQGIIEERLFGVKIVAVADTAMISEVNNDALWEKHSGRLADKLRTLAGDGLFTARNEEPNWAKAHNILTPAFVKAAMVRYHATMTDAVREMIQTWKTPNGSDIWVDVPTETNRLTMEVIARAGLGHSFSKLNEPGDLHPFLDAIARQLRYATRRTDAIPLYDSTIGIKEKRQHRADKAYIRGHIADIIEARRRNPTTHEGPGDILDMMLNNADPDSGEKLDDDNMINQILTLLVAGSETSANAIAFALHLLATHPDVAARAREEIDQHWPGRDYPNIEFADVAKLRYLRRVVDESLRLYPVAPGYFRQAREDTALGGKYLFRKGEHLLVLLTAAHRDPAWGPDADEFNPDRFVPENLRKLPPHIYKAFGTGPRACIGRQFALHEILIALAAILHQYDLRPKPGYELQVRDAISIRPIDLELSPQPRT